LSYSWLFTTDFFEIANSTFRNILFFSLLRFGFLLVLFTLLLFLFATPSRRRLRSRQGAKDVGPGKNGLVIVGRLFPKLGLSNLGVRRFVGGKRDPTRRRRRFALLFLALLVVVVATLVAFLLLLLLFVQVGQQIVKVRHVRMVIVVGHRHGRGAQSQTIGSSLDAESFGGNHWLFVVAVVVVVFIVVGGAISPSFANALPFFPTHFGEHLGANIVGFPFQVSRVGRCNRGHDDDDGR